MDKFPDCITHAYVMLTEECPCRCEYCWVKDRANHLTITEDKIEALVNRFSGNTKPLLIFFGGEPLLKQDLIANTVEKYKQKKIYDCPRVTFAHDLKTILRGHV